MIIVQALKLVLSCLTMNLNYRFFDCKYNFCKSLSQVDYGADTKTKNKYKHDPASYAINRGFNILVAEFNQTLFNRRVSAISRNLQEKKDAGTETSPAGAFSRQSSMSWHDWGSMSHDTTG